MSVSSSDSAARIAVESHWQGATGGCLIAAGCGAALMEVQRHGQVVVIIPAIAVQEPLAQMAAQLAVRVQATALTLVIVSDKSADSEWLLAHGWREAGAGPVVRQLVPAKNTETIVAPRLVHEHQPVHLPILMPGALPVWPVDSLSTPLSSVADWLSWLAVREPLLVVADLVCNQLRLLLLLLVVVLLSLYVSC